jgi:hypothetical protein
MQSGRQTPGRVVMERWVGCGQAQLQHAENRQGNPSKKKKTENPGRIAWLKILASKFESEAGP